MLGHQPALAVMLAQSPCWWAPARQALRAKRCHMHMELGRREVGAEATGRQVTLELADDGVRQHSVQLYAS